MLGHLCVCRLVSDGAFPKLGWYRWIRRARVAGLDLTRHKKERPSLAGLGVSAKPIPKICANGGASDPDRQANW